MTFAAELLDPLAFVSGLLLWQLPGSFAVQMACIK